MKVIQIYGLDACDGFLGMHLSTNLSSCIHQFVYRFLYVKDNNFKKWKKNGHVDS